MVHLNDKITQFFNNRWLVFVAAMWIQSCAGVGYVFGSISPAIKRSLNYNQQQVSRLGVAKDLGDSNFLGYGVVWLVVTGRAPALPLWAMCVVIFVGTNGETYFNTAALVSCVQNFPKSRGPVVGILKGFAGLSGAILSQIYVLIHSPDSASLIFMVAVGPAMVVISLMFIVRPVGGHRQIRSSDGKSSSVIYCVCLILAAYLMGVMLVEDLVDLNHNVIIIFTVILFIILLIPIVIPIWLMFAQEPEDDVHEALLTEEQKEGVDLLPATERQKRIAQLQAKLCQAAAEGAVRVKSRRGPHRGEDFTLMQALIKADFWLIFFSLLLGSGSGLTVIDNLGQMSQSFGYDNTHIFVSLISIWNFLGRVGGGYFSEIIVRDYAYPRHLAMAVGSVHNGIWSLFYGHGLTSFIMSGLCILAVILSMTLVYRTKVVYANLYRKSRT
ncbi:Protein NUCLEAR FUSION DEFECTIVE 4-like [Heracleum sosnowskyi]|uniref:Protein NUCLEAR FUSION DEFECTIVE 4-like n=1 Tax=Heracleum sosnowskyi TaxID=360622 RepID=A0AAD8LVR8_9APIA|nr:Protein NUCLEAR FUSION DEFECTIVE 4-like [Heracleum sosnowskyi]